MAAFGLNLLYVFKMKFVTNWHVIKKVGITLFEGFLTILISFGLWFPGAGSANGRLAEQLSVLMS